jgi:hypothetical protein
MTIKPKKIIKIPLPPPYSFKTAKEKFDWMFKQLNKQPGIKKLMRNLSDL